MGVEQRSVKMLSSIAFLHINFFHICNAFCAAVPPDKLEDTVPFPVSPPLQSRLYLPGIVMLDSLSRAGETSRIMAAELIINPSMLTDALAKICWGQDKTGDY